MVEKDPKDPFVHPKVTQAEHLAEQKVAFIEQRERRDNPFPPNHDIGVPLGHIILQGDKIQPPPRRVQ